MKRLAGLILSAAILTIGVVGVRASDAQVPARCPTPAAVSPAASADQVQVKSTKDSLKLEVDRHREPVSDSLTYEGGPLPDGELDFRAGPFRHRGHRLKGCAITIIEERRTTKSIELSVTVDPAQAENIENGTYTGSIRVFDSRLSGNDVPVTITVQSAHTNLLGLLGIPATSLIGWVGVWLAGDRAKTLATWAAERWLFLLAGAVAAFGVWAKLALGSPTFGEDGLIWITTVGSMIAAAHTVANGTSAFKR